MSKPHTAPRKQRRRTRRAREPIYLASDRAKLKELLTAEASAAAGSPVTLTFDLDVYRRISPDMSDEVKAFILKKLGT